MNYWWRQIKVSEVAEVVLGCFIYVKSGKAQIKACDFLHKLNHSDSFPSKKPFLHTTAGLLPKAAGRG